MPDYSKSKIYEIVCRITGEKYIGSTTVLLCQRLAHHRDFKTSHCSCISRQIIERGDYYINLIEEYPCENKEQLLKKEREWYDKLECINKNKPYSSKEELIERKKKYDKKYCEDNKEKIAEQKKKNYEINKEKIAEQRKKYYEAKKQNK